MENEIPTPEALTTLTENNQNPTPEPINVPAPAPATLPAELLTAYNGLVAESRQETERLRRENERLLAERNAPPALTPEESSAEFFKDPVKMIREEIARSLAPINEQASALNRREQYSELKRQMRADGANRFKDLSLIETEFDVVMQAQELNPNNMIAAYYAIYGRAVAEGRINPNAAPAVPETTRTQAPAATVVTPPHMRPSAPPAPVDNNNPAKKLRPLTENEETVRRFNKMTHEEYLELLDKPATEVVKRAK